MIEPSLSSSLRKPLFTSSVSPSSNLGVPSSSASAAPSLPLARGLALELSNTLPTSAHAAVVTTSIATHRSRFTVCSLRSKAVSHPSSCGCRRPPSSSPSSDTRFFEPRPADDPLPSGSPLGCPPKSSQVPWGTPSSSTSASVGVALEHQLGAALPRSRLGEPGNEPGVDVAQAAKSRQRPTPPHLAMSTSTLLVVTPVTSSFFFLKVTRLHGLGELRRRAEVGDAEASPCPWRSPSARPP